MRRPARRGTSSGCRLRWFYLRKVAARGRKVGRSTLRRCRRACAVCCVASSACSHTQPTRLTAHNDLLPSPYLILVHHPRQSEISSAPAAVVDRRGTVVSKREASSESCSGQPRIGGSACRERSQLPIPTPQHCGKEVTCGFILHPVFQNKPLPPTRQQTSNPPPPFAVHPRPTARLLTTSVATAGLCAPPPPPRHGFYVRLHAQFSSPSIYPIPSLPWLYTDGTR